MTDARDDRDPLEVLVERFVERRRRGEMLSVDQFARAHPGLADELRELLPAVEAVEGLKAQGERSSDGLASLGGGCPQRLGDFRILREIGRGGMGVVFEAEQESLCRRVALKVLPPQALLERRHLARFRREARIASRLHHTNIVQVHGVGAHDGLHYYAMQYVHGIGLDEVLRRLRQTGRPGAGEPPGDGARGAEGGPPAGADDPADERSRAVMARVPGGTPGGSIARTDAAYVRFVADLARQAADALAYAHRQGTLHLDIKPSNLLLDDRGVVWLTDFGLARAVHLPEITRAGDVTGTLRYLAPERLDAQSGPACDVYSLGLTLYELLTGRAGFEQRDTSALIEAIHHRSPPRPRSIRPQVPRDLETIVLKAIARRGEHRYPSAKALRDDLRRFLEDRPVQARRVGPVGRLWRWSRRNRALAALSASTMALLLAVAILTGAGYVRTRRALESEAIQRRRAERLADLAGEALDRVFAQLAPVRVAQPALTVGADDGATVRLIGQPVVSREAAALLEEMLPFFDRLAEQSGGDATLQLRAARAGRRVGDIRRRLGRYDQAVESYRRALARYEALPAGTAPVEALRVARAETCNELGRTLLLLRRPDEARQAHRRAVELLGPAGVAEPAAARLARARTHYHLGQRVHPEPGLRPAHRPPPPGRAGRGDPPPQHGPGLWGPISRLAAPPAVVLAPGPDPRDEALREQRNAHLRRAIAILEDLRRTEPDNPSMRHLQALCYREIVPDRDQAGGGQIDRAIALLEGLVEDFPRLADYQFDLCETYAAVEAPGKGPGPPSPRQAQRRLSSALEVARRLTAGHPNVPEYLASRARLHHKYADLLRRTHRLADAIEHNREALTIQRGLVEGFPEIAGYRVWEAAFGNALAECLLRDGRGAEARRLAGETIDRLDAMRSGDPEMWYLHGLLADAHRTLAGALRGQGLAERAEKADRLADAHRAALREAMSSRDAR